ncbi:baseplate J/gp47 family protein [Dickeya solani]|uniref:Baseplate J/gp47 family protein n=1 Tax=Dickeya solani TaxID=1089444 RepID=A0ABU4EHB4_9GAMM|nr:baseplate J/gp47 family protein [Dickeya solani]MCZ0823719.1 baseplate J/gp47 family protein [Dickeya solani]MDV6995626.1 baseplate J/gp47 family protein [Dickeya solani]MDV7002905.1 baseplate J/gp47 family protein [Dickeya solani]MDV7036681.1 baseplate J/gp47 family protein [Dickeya solani]MDV7043434.1 baseplate J/gp47 family protein [Dickeya solani]
MADSGFSRQTLPQLITTIRSDVLSRLAADSTLAELRRSDAEVYGRVQAAAVHVVYGYIDYLARNLLPDLADEVWLTRHGNMKRVTRKAAGAASGFVRWDGVTGGTVDSGVTIQRDDLMSYTTTASATASGGVLRVPVTCDEVGTVGNTDDGITMRLVSPVTGLPSAAVADEIRGGTDIESVEDFRARIIERWYYPPQGGADTDYIAWAKEVSGVTRAWCYRHWMGTGTVGVMISNSDLVNPIPDAAIVAAAQNYIEPLVPVAGADLYVFAPTPHTVNFEIDLNPDTLAVRAAVEAELRSMMLRDGVPDGVIKPSRISEAISSATGEYSHRLVSPSADISIARGAIGVVGAITWD